MQLVNILVMPTFAAAVFAAEGQYKGFSAISTRKGVVKDLNTTVSSLFLAYDLAHTVNLTKRLSAADVEELDHYASETLAGLDELLENILDMDFAAAETEYNGIAPLFQQMMRYAAPPKSFCVVNGAGQKITQAQAVGLIRGVQMSLQSMLQAALTQNQGHILAGLCDAQTMYLNSGLREIIFHGKVSGTAS